jgi:hypothetical protein
MRVCTLRIAQRGIYPSSVVAVLRSAIYADGEQDAPMALPLALRRSWSIASTSLHEFEVEIMNSEATKELCFGVSNEQAVKSARRSL